MGMETEDSPQLIIIDEIIWSIRRDPSQYDWHRIRTAMLEKGICDIWAPHDTVLSTFVFVKKRDSWRYDFVCNAEDYKPVS